MCKQTAICKNAFIQLYLWLVYYPALSYHSFIFCAACKCYINKQQLWITRYTGVYMYYTYIYAIVVYERIRLSVRSLKVQAAVATRPAVFNETRARLTSDRLPTHERMHHDRVTSVLFKWKISRRSRSTLYPHTRHSFVLIRLNAVDNPSVAIWFIRTKCLILLKFSVNSTWY